MTDEGQEAMERMLARAAAEERDIQREVEADVRAEDVELARSFVEQRLGSQEPAVRRPAAWLPMAAAAAALLLLWLGWGLLPESAPESVRLGGGPIELLAPTGQVEEWTALRWAGPLKAGEQWTVTVQVPAPGGGWTEALSAQTSANEWALPPELLAGPAATLRWRVECLAMGVSSGWQTAERQGDR